MRSRFLILCLCFLAMFCSQHAQAQFKENAFSQTYVSDSTATTDTSEQLFSFKNYFGGLAHKNKVKIGPVFGMSAVLPGTAQIYNRDYWKLPIIYGSMGALAGTGGYYLYKYNVTAKQHDKWSAAQTEFTTSYPWAAWTVPEPTIDTKSKTVGTWLMVGAGLVYWASMLDGVVCYEKDQHPHPGRATVYSILLPGLGQAYNGEYWKIPVYYSGLIASGYFLYTNHVNYTRFRRIYNEATSSTSSYTGSISSDTAQYYRNLYRRYRDYSIVALVAVYLLQVIDANVFAYMHDFDVSDDITLNLSPTVISPNNAYAFGGYGNSAVGLSIGLRF